MNPDEIEVYANRWMSRGRALVDLAADIPQDLSEQVLEDAKAATYAVAVGMENAGIGLSFGQATMFSMLATVITSGCWMAGYQHGSLPKEDNDG